MNKVELIGTVVSDGEITEGESLSFELLVKHRTKKGDKWVDDGEDKIPCLYNYRPGEKFNVKEGRLINVKGQIRNMTQGSYIVVCHSIRPHFIPPRNKDTVEMI